MSVELDFNLLDFVGPTEKVILNLSTEIKDGMRKFPRKVLLTNKKFILGSAYGPCVFPLNTITYVSINDEDRDNITLCINDWSGIICSQREEAKAKKILTELVKQL